MERAFDDPHAAPRRQLDLFDGDTGGGGRGGQAVGTVNLDGVAAAAEARVGEQQQDSVRIYVPAGFAAKRVELSDGLTPAMATNGNLLTVDYTSSTGKDVEWKVIF